MPIDFEIQQGLHFVFTNLPNLGGNCPFAPVESTCPEFLPSGKDMKPQNSKSFQIQHSKG